MNSYQLQIDEEALDDIQKITDCYNERSKGLGTRFQKQAKLQINSLKNNADIYMQSVIEMCVV